MIQFENDTMRLTDLTPQQANEVLCKQMEATWNQCDETEILKLFESDAKWKHMNRHYTGLDEIREFLETRSRYFLHYQIQVLSWISQGPKVSATLESKWQSSKTGQWYRSSGMAVATLSENQRLKRLDTLSHGKIVYPGVC